MNLCHCITDLFWWGERSREPKVFCSVAARRQTAADRIQNGDALPRHRYARSIHQHQHRRILRGLQSADYADLRRTEICGICEICGWLINKNKNGSILSGFDDILKLPVSRDGRFELGQNCRHGFEEAQQKTALDRVIHILRQRPAHRQRRRRIQLEFTLQRVPLPHPQAKA